MLEEEVVSTGMVSEPTPDDEEESMVMVLFPLEVLLLLILLWIRTRRASSGDKV